MIACPSPVRSVPGSTTTSPVTVTADVAMNSAEDQSSDSTAEGGSIRPAAPSAISVA